MSDSKRTATLWVENGWIVCRASLFNDDNGALQPVTSFKSEIGGRQRKWDPQQKLWMFDPGVAPHLEAILKRHGFDITMLNPAATAAPPALADQSTSAMTDFLGLIPDAVLKDCYRKAMIELHPDRGGSVDASAKLNAAWDIIKKGRGL